MKRNVLTIGNINVHLDHDLIFKGGKILTTFSNLKENISKNHPELVKKYRMKSKLVKGEIVRIINWSGLLTELVEDNKL